MQGEYQILRDSVSVGNASVLIERPSAQTEKIILFLPGISGGAHAERFQPLVDAALAAQMAIARVSLWESEEDVLKTSPREIFAAVDAVVADLRGRGYTHIVGVGKSFGGGVLLAYVNDIIEAKVLWAPAIGCADTANVAHISYVEAEHLTDVTVDGPYVAAYHGRVCFIHGTADLAIPFSNSEKLHALLPGSSLVPIEGADHSYKNKEHEQEVIQKTIQFLS